MERRLLLEEVFKSGPRIVRARGSRGSCGAICRVSNRGRILLDRHAKFKKCAVVLAVFFRDTFRNWLRALKLLSCIEVDTLLAAVQLGMAAQAFAIRIEPGRQDSSATIEHLARASPCPQCAVCGRTYPATWDAARRAGLLVLCARASFRRHRGSGSHAGHTSAPPQNPRRDVSSYPGTS